MGKYQRIQGMRDVFPEDHEYFTFMKKVVRYHARRSGLKRISLPAFELADAYRDTIGVGTNIVDKQLYTLVTDDQEVALRPDFTTGIVRAYLDNDFSEKPFPLEYYYIDTRWRNVTPSQYELRQVHEFGFELIGEQDPALDAQIIEMCANIYHDLGLENVTLRINNVGSREAQEQFREDLRNFYAGKERSLTPECLDLLEKNPIRLLHCQDEDAKILAEIAPKFSSVMDKASQQHHEKVKEYLEELGVAYEEDPMLFRDFDYYTRTVFEFSIEENNQEVLLGGGGRYDTLIEEMGGEPTPAVGFSGNMDVALEQMKKVHIRVPSKDRVDVFVVQLGDTAKKIALKLVSDLRAKGVKTLGALGKDSMRAQLDGAGKFEVRYALVLGQMEVVENKIIIRDMEKGTQEILPFEDIVDHMVKLLGASSLDTKDFRGMIEEASEIE